MAITAAQKASAQATIDAFKEYGIEFTAAREKAMVRTLANLLAHGKTNAQIADYLSKAGFVVKQLVALGTEVGLGDTDGDGKVSKAELAALKTEVVTFTTTEVAKADAAKAAADAAAAAEATAATTASAVALAAFNAAATKAAASAAAATAAYTAAATAAAAVVDATTSAASTTAAALAASTAATAKTDADAEQAAAVKLAAAVKTTAETTDDAAAATNSAAAITVVAAADAAVTAAAAQVSAAAAAATQYAVVVGQTFNLTNSIDAMSGTAANDTFTAILSDGSGTYNGGDDINGHSGNDTLNLLMASSTAAGLVTLTDIETINVRLLDASGTGSVNGVLWSGVTTLSNASSLADTSFAVSGISTTTTVKIYDQTDLTVDFTGLTSATDTASVSLVNAGSGSASTAVDAIVVDLDKDNSGLLDAATIAVSGSNYVNVEGGADLRTLTLVGGATADYNVFTVSATTLLSTLDASATFSDNHFFVSGRTDTTVIGGAGNDKIEFGTALSNADSINGGAGTDTITATLGSSVIKLNSTNTENATITLGAVGGGSLDASASTVVTYEVVAGIASASGSLINLNAGAVVNLVTDTTDAFSIDTKASGTLTVNIGSSSSTVSVSAISITDAISLTLNSVGSGLNTAGVVTDAAATTIALTTTGEADLLLTDLQVAAVTSVTLTANGSGFLTLTSGLESVSALSSITLLAQGSDAADITLGVIGTAAATSLSTMSVIGTSGADITLAGLKFGPAGVTANGTTTITMAAGNGSIVGTSAFDISATGVALTINASAGVSGTIGIGTIAIDVGTVASGGSLTFGNLALTADSVVRVDTINVAGTAQSVNFGSMVVGASGGLDMASAGGINGTNTKNVVIGAIDLTVGNGSAGFGAIASAQSIGSIVVNATDGASAAFGNISALTASTIDVTMGGSAAVTFGTFGNSATAFVGDITVRGSGDSDFVMGNLGGSASKVNNITVTVDASASANFANISASGVGSITVSGDGWVDFGIVSAVSVGGVDLRGQTTGGTFNIDLSGVTNAVTIDSGKGTNTITSGNGDDTINLQTGLGTDNIIYSSTAQKLDTISRFEMGTADDKIEISVSAMSAAGVTLVQAFSAAAGLATGTVAVDLALVSASGALTAGDNIIVLRTGAYASTAQMMSAIATGGSLSIGLGSATAGSMMVVWSDGTDSYVSLVAVGAGATGFSSAASVDTLATIVGVNVAGTTGVAAGNFDFV